MRRVGYITGIRKTYGEVLYNVSCTMYTEGYHQIIRKALNLMNTIALKKLTDKDIDKFYSKSTLIRNASYRNMTIVQYRNWLKGTK